MNEGKENKYETRGEERGKTYEAKERKKDEEKFKCRKGRRRTCERDERKKNNGENLEKKPILRKLKSDKEESEETKRT